MEKLLRFFVLFVVSREQYASSNCAFFAIFKYVTKSREQKNKENLEKFNWLKGWISAYLSCSQEQHLVFSDGFANCSLSC